MTKEKIDSLCENKDTEAVITALLEAVEEEYEEYAMYRLTNQLFLAGEEKEARKWAKKTLRLFPAGEYLLQLEALLAGKIEASESENLVTKPSITKESPVKDTDSLASMFSHTKKEKKERVIPQSIKECFEDTVGLQKVTEELDKFYKLLRFQTERKQNDFQADLISSTHFAVVGPRGCGKTMVGSILAKLLCDFGVREEEKAVLVDATELLKQYRGNGENGILSIFDNLNEITVIIENLQNILPDENQSTDELKNIMRALEKLMRVKKNSLSIILTGNENAMRQCLQANDTLEDALYAVITMPTYSSLDLLQIAQKLAKERALLLRETTKKSLLKKIDLEYRSPDFMNAITLGRYLDDASVRMAERYYQSESDAEEKMVYLMPEDFNIELDEESPEELLNKLDQMVGLASVKEQIRKRIQSIIATNQAKEAGAELKGEHGSLHMLFTGNPGTGKTTVANLMGKLYQQLGILPRGSHMVVCTRSDLVGQYQGHTAKLVQEKVREAMGGVLFIDEAYALCRDASDTFGHEAVDELIAAMENNKDNMMVILAGYSKEMQEFLKSNPGFRSRIRNDIEFEDYSVEEMCAIFRNMVKGKGMQMSDDCNEVLHQLLETRSRKPDFGNARGVRNTLEDVIEAMNERLVRESRTGIMLDKTQYETISVQDLQSVLGKKLEGEKTLEELLEELNSLTGLAGVKKKVQEMVDDIQVKSYMKNAGIQGAEGHGTLHLVFKGNAGTGKTTVARLLGQIYKLLGLLKKDVFVEVGRKDLVASYVGQTAQRVIAKIQEAEGGILFIDEAYTLIGGERDEFGMEAVNTLVAELENRRESLMVIVAGYGTDMDKFLDANQGLASRLSNEIVFEDYTLEELLSIAGHMIEQKGMKLEEGAEDLLLATIERERQRTKDFGNARGVRNLLEKLEKCKNTRVASMMRKGMEITEDEVITIRKEDIVIL